MADRQALQTVEVTLASGLKTRLRVRADKAERYRRLSRQADPKQAAKDREAETRARTPRTATGDVETK